MSEFVDGSYNTVSTEISLDNSKKLTDISISTYVKEICLQEFSSWTKMVKL
jgi:hypothetical protein